MSTDNHEVNHQKSPEKIQNGEQGFQHAEGCEGLSQSESKPCNDCGLKFPSKKLWNQHVKYHCTVKLNLRNAVLTAEHFSCKHCNMKFSSKRLLNQHVQYHCTVKLNWTNEVLTHKHFPCKNCNLKFSSKRLLYQHVLCYCAEKTKPNKTLSYRISCKFCNLKFSSKSLIIRHIKFYCTAKPNPTDAKVAIKAIEKQELLELFKIDKIDDVEPCASNSLDIPLKHNSIKLRTSFAATADLEHEDTEFVDNVVPEQTDEDWVEIIELNEEEVDCFAINTTISMKDEPSELEDIGESVPAFEIETAALTIKTEIKEELDVDFGGISNSTLSDIEIKTENLIEEDIKEEPQDPQSQFTMMIKAEISDEEF
jgi:Zinc finger, C2H2 type